MFVIFVDSGKHLNKGEPPARNHDKPWACHVEVVLNVLTMKEPSGMLVVEGIMRDPN